MSMSQLADVTGLDRRTVKERLIELKPDRTVGKAIIYDSRLALPVLLGFNNANSKDIAEQLKETNLEYELAKTEMIQIELEVLKGLQVPIEDVRKTVEKEYTYVRASLLSIPSKRAKVLALESDPATIREHLEQDINEALSHLQADKNYLMVEETAEMEKPNAD